MSAVSADEVSSTPSFRDLALSEPVLRALTDVGYEAPSPIQAATIPVLLSGVDMLGQAQTGTGKTAAFALPALTHIDLSKHEPQVLVLVPTRELALQVAEAFLKYAAHLKGFHVLPIYGGQMIDHAEPARWQVLQVRPFVPNGLKKGLVMSTFPYVLRTPEESKVNKGLGKSIPPERLRDAANARTNRTGSLYRAEPRKNLRTLRDTFGSLLLLIIALTPGE